MTRLWLIALLASVSACTLQESGSGRFCDVVRGPITFPPEVARVVVSGARSEAVKIDAQNRYGEANCGW